MKKIVLTGDFSHETNTFNEHPPGKAEFEAYYAIFNEQLLTRFKNVNHEQAGFIDCADSYIWNLVPTVVATANPGGKVTKEAFDRYGGSILEKAKLRNLDGIALSLHRAMIVEDIFAAEEELL